MQNTLESIDEALSKNCAVTEYLNQQQKENNERFGQLMRKKWWLLNPDIVEISYIAVYETNYSHSEWESYPEISWMSIIDKSGKDISLVVGELEYYALESEITDEETVITVWNPYISSAETA